MRIERNKLSSQVLAVLRDMIANERFHPGARINVEELTRELGVSRTPVWEAIHRLEQEGLLVRIANRGVFMAELTLEQSQDLYEVRKPLEALAGRLAAERIDDATVRRMEHIIDQQRLIVERGDVVAYSRSDFEFHAAVYVAAGNPYLQDVLERLKAKMRPLNLHVERYLRLLLRDHTRLLDALRARDPDAAEAVLGEHNQHLIEAIHEAQRSTERRAKP
ncbi:MAG TPA: GntR family transcriptional regulator [Anaeromyxobacteraceae bacterium]|nr:GntR family transcriptional regulator [Anaeromyxobacteraceae bacterium]